MIQNNKILFDYTKKIVRMTMLFFIILKDSVATFRFFHKM